jgi:hypothetical protein
MVQIFAHKFGARSDRLLERLATIPTPSGPLPGEQAKTFIPLSMLQASRQRGNE